MEYAWCTFRRYLEEGHVETMNKTFQSSRCNEEISFYYAENGLKYDNLESVNEKPARQYGNE